VALLRTRAPSHQLLVVLGTRDGGAGATGLSSLDDLGQAQLFVASTGGAADAIFVTGQHEDGGARLNAFAFGPRGAP